MARLKEKYRKEIVPALQEKLGLTNAMSVPVIEKITVNMGVGEAQQEADKLEEAIEQLASITGQKPVVTKARQSISGFKLRAGSKVACMVTLRGDRMYEFLDRLINVAVPRIRDFRGVRTKFDKQGNYTLGIADQSIFPEVNVNNVTRARGMNICFTIKKAEKPGQSYALLKAFGMPFRQ